MRALETTSAFVFALLICAPATHAAQRADVREEAWLQVAHRDRPTYLELGLGLSSGTGAELPQDATFLALSPVAELRAGHFLHPLLAVEVAGLTTSTRTGALLSSNHSEFSRQRVSVGTRFALPQYISPYLTAQLGYQHSTGSWSNGSNDCFLCTSEPPEGGITGKIETDGLTVGGEFGLQVAYGYLTASLHVAREWWVDASSEIETQSHGQPELDADVPDAPDSLSVAAASLGVRVGVRF